MVDNIAGYIDHTLLKPEAGRADYDRVVEECIRYGFKAVCVNSFWVEYMARKLGDSPVAICSVAGFPLGIEDSRSKAFEAERAAVCGADEIDMVINVGLLRSGMYERVESDIRCVRDSLKPDRILKVILETCLLTDDEKVAACEIAVKAGADFVKTSTGFNSAGARVEDVRLMRKAVGPDIGVKASGGIRSFEAALAMIEAGANRIGAGSSVEIVQGCLKP